MNITARHLKALERIFSAEIQDRLPLQSKAKIFEELEAEGYVEKFTRSFGVDHFDSIQVTGWELTLLGNITYCMSCK